MAHGHTATMPQSCRNKYFRVTIPISEAKYSHHYNIGGKIFSPLQYLRQNILTNSYFPNLEYQYSSRISLNSNITLIGPFSQAYHPGKIMSKKSQTKIGWHAWKEVVLATRRARTVSTLFCLHRWETFWLGNRNPYFYQLHIVRKLETEIKQ